MRGRASPRRLAKRILGLRGLAADDSGASATEFALGLIVLTIPLLNVVDLALYAHHRMQAENAAQAGAQAAWTTCSTPAQWPATDSTKCPGLATAVSGAIAGTSLGAGVAQSSGSPAEGYYFATTTGALQLVGVAGVVGTPPTGRPADCSGVTNAADPKAVPGDYVQVSVSYIYKPLFKQISISSLLPTPITKTTWVRLQ